MNGGKAVAEKAENCEEEVFSDCNTGGLCLKVRHRTYVVGNLPSTKRFFRRCAHMFCEGGCPLRMFGRRMRRPYGCISWVSPSCTESGCPSDLTRSQIVKREGDPVGRPYVRDQGYRKWVSAGYQSFRVGRMSQRKNDPYRALREGRAA